MSLKDESQDIKKEAMKSLPPCEILYVSKN